MMRAMRFGLVTAKYAAANTTRMSGTRNRRSFTPEKNRHPSRIAIRMRPVPRS